VHVTQSAISRRIGQIREVFGIKNFERVACKGRGGHRVHANHRIASEGKLLFKVYAPTPEALEKVVDSLTPYVATTTMLVFSSPVTRRDLEPPEDGALQATKGAKKKSPRPSSRR
jgi:hypothetical protein